MSLEYDPLRFCWHIDNLVAGSARPGRYGDLRDDLARLKEEGIEVIVNLCSEPVEIPPEFEDSFRQVHVPVVDGHPPEAEQLEEIMGEVLRAKAGGKKVVIHCRGGVGRTATVLIPLIMELEGVSMDDAIGRLRKAGRYTQSMHQWEFLREWAGKR